MKINFNLLKILNIIIIIWIKVIFCEIIFIYGLFDLEFLDVLIG